MHIVAAEGALLQQIVDLTYPVWHEGLTPAAYAQWNGAQVRMPWGRDHLTRLALVDDDGSLLASLKRYRYDVRIDQRDGWMCGIGAVFTPPDRRGRGHASALIERVLAKERQAGALLAVLFSEIGTEYDEKLGFSAVALDEVTVNVKRKDGAPAMLVRAGGESDIAALANLHRVRSASARVALRRDTPMIAFALAKKRMFAGLSPLGHRQLEFFVAEEGAGAVAYVVLSGNQHGWTLEEAGDRDPAAARLGGMLQVLVAREPSRPLPIIRAWWPRGFAVPPQIELTGRTDARDVLMVRALADVEVPTHTDDFFYWRSDYF